MPLSQRMEQLRMVGRQWTLQLPQQELITNKVHRRTHLQTRVRAETVLEARTQIKELKEGNVLSVKLSCLCTHYATSIFGILCPLSSSCCSNCLCSAHVLS